MFYRSNHFNDNETSIFLNCMTEMYLHVSIIYCIMLN